MKLFSLMMIAANVLAQPASARPTTVCDSMAYFYNTHGYTCQEADLGWFGGSNGLVYNCSGYGTSWTMAVRQNAQGTWYCGQARIEI